MINEYKEQTGEDDSRRQIENKSIFKIDFTVLSLRIYFLKTSFNLFNPFTELTDSNFY